MRITRSAIAMTAQWERHQAYSLAESLRVTTRAGPASETGRNPMSGGDRLELSPEARALLEQQRVERAAPIDPEDRIRMLILQIMLGIDVKVPVLPARESEAADEQSGQRPVPREFEYERHETYAENERLSFQAAGVIRTADGQEIKFSVAFAMSRSFYTESHLAVRTSRPVDPLVINFDGDLADLTERKYHFDIDADGRMDLVHMLKPGSGFLALDKNSDGVINDGRELFGPATGNAFAELKRYDSDGNDWIDENDPIYHKLVIYTKDANGKDLLFALGAKGVGAIYLGSLRTPFTMTDSQNQALAQQQRAGLFLRTDRTVGTMQQIDLVI